MNALSNEVLRETYFHAVQLNLEQGFIQLLLEELKRRDVDAIICN